MDENFWKGKHFSFFQNKECEYFPCHKTDKPEDFNCLFCYCPLYALGDKCGGDFTITEDGIKDCSNCMLPHVKDNYAYIKGKYSEILDLVKTQISETEDK
ncbi:MAG: cysteine-rich small domain-containing protein [Peptostreptococcaceae bacterium]|nr:cysteine-rich small domain-containing protein [Peptostreptococcaceae bacterium]